MSFFNNKNKEDKLAKTSEGLLYDKFKKYEIFSLIGILIGISLGSVFGVLEATRPENINYIISRIIIALGILITIISTIFFTYYYFKMKKLKGDYL